MNSQSAPYSIANRLSQRLALAVCGLLVIAGFAIDGLIRLHSGAEFDRALLAKAQTLALLLEQDEDGVDFDYVPGALPEFSVGPGAEYFELWFANWPQSRRAEALQEAHLPRFGDRSLHPRYRALQLPDGRAGRSIQLDFFPHLDPKENLDPATLTRSPATLLVARDRARLDHAVQRMRLALMLIVAITLGCSWGIVRMTVARSLRPLAEIRAQLAAMHARALHTRLTLQEQIIELAPVVDQFNALLAILENAFSREQEFAAAAAHELRTPLAEIRRLAEIGGRFADDSALAREYYADIVAAVIQLESLARNLLALARHDHDQPAKVGGETFDLARACAQAWQRTAVSAADRALRFEYRGPATVVVRAKREMVDLILTNLISNTIAYSPVGAAVTLEITVEGAQVTLTLANPNDDLEESDLSRVFDRFWRKDEARHVEGHAGLGLALVRAYGTQLKVKCAVLIDAQRRFVIRLEGFELVGATAVAPV